MPRINNIEDMSEHMREGAVKLVIANYLDSNESFSKYDVTSGVRALLSQIADFTHADVRQIIGDEMIQFVNHGGDYGDEIVNGPNGEYILYTPNTVSDDKADEDEDETDDVEVDTDDVDTFDMMWLNLINDGVTHNDKLTVTKYDTNTYKIQFDTGVFVLLMTDANKAFLRATVHTQNGIETGTIDSFKELIDNINELYDLLDDVQNLNPQSSMCDATDVINKMSATGQVDWIATIDKAFTDAGKPPIKVEKLDVTYTDSDAFYVALERDADGEDKFVVSVVIDENDEMIAGFLHEYSKGVLSGDNLDDLVKDSIDYINLTNSVVVDEPTTSKTTRVYIGKVFCDEAGFKAGIKLKISIKNQRVVAITKGKDDDYNYTVNADGRIRISSNYLDAIGLNNDNMKVTAYKGMIMISNVD